MSQNTWNFHTWQDRDLGVGSARGTVGGTWVVESQTLPFSSAISGVVSFLIRSDYTANKDDQTGTYHWLHSISYRTADEGGSVGLRDAMTIRVYNDPAGTGYVEFYFWDKSANTLRYQYRLGDEDGINGLQTDKWYQVAFSADATSFQYVVNGSTTPLVVLATSNPGALNLDFNTERWWFSSGASSGFFLPTSIGSGYASVLRGPAAFDGSSLDLSDSAVRARIFDADGNLNPAGENGSLWFNDAYTTTAGYKPDAFLPDGSGRLEKGSAGLTIDPQNGGGGSWADCPGGLRKFYE